MYRNINSLKIVETIKFIMNIDYLFTKLLLFIFSGKMRARIPPLLIHEETPVYYIMWT